VPRAISLPTGAGRVPAQRRSTPTVIEASGEPGWRETLVLFLLYLALLGYLLALPFGLGLDALQLLFAGSGSARCSHLFLLVASGTLAPLFAFGDEFFGAFGRQDRIASRRSRLDSFLWRRWLARGGAGSTGGTTPLLALGDQVLGCGGGQGAGRPATVLASWAAAGAAKAKPANTM
jgi:hypothetical protein